MTRTLANSHTKEAFRFFLIAVAGLGIDIGVAWALIAFSTAPDSAAAVVGFSVATVTNYFGHQFWTFREGEQRVSLRRFMAFAGVVVLTLAVRLLILDLLGPPSGIGETPVTDAVWEYPVSAQNALQRWDHARHF